MNFCLIIGKDAFYIYRLKNVNWEIENIDGNPFLRYRMHTIKSDIVKLMDALVDKNNLNGADDLDFTVLENADDVRTVSVKNVLGKRLKETVNLNTVLIRLIQKLRSKAELRIDSFGVNYDGYCYKIKDNRLWRSPYNLLAYRIEYNKALDFIKG